MKKFMVISVIEGEQGATFFDSYEDAKQHVLAVACGMGGITYTYQLNDKLMEYEFLEA